ncbi:MAG: cytochrome c maturation protein CcmE [Candidatus Latescibacteria bacterium]|nr:cytochrome c maturation protein CcmE [Candidatus Latescibacterota bacterium]
MKKYQFLFGSLIIAAGLIYLFASGVQQSSAMHLTLPALMDQLGHKDFKGQRLQLGGGTVVPGSIKWDEYHHRPEFTITDGEHSLQVRYSGSTVLPDTFKDKAIVVLEGHYRADQQLFDAQVVFAKCPSKYEGQSYDDHADALNEKQPL